ncbi:MAG: glycine cleavage system protein H [Acidobacteriia bacterium]|nr:glycine cleavage system protein H [Terriglobia bacterium]
MSDAKTDRPLRHLLREDADPCIWMAAGQVAYKLCDRGFRCEECLLDACFRGQGSAGFGSVRDVPAAAAEPEFPDDRLYDTGHTWAGVVADGRIRIGLDAFASRLLRHVSGIVLPPAGGRVERGHVGCWVTDENVTLSLKSPVSGTVVRSNPRLRSSPALAAESPYTEGWLLEVACENAEAAVNGLLGAPEIRARAQADLNRLRDLSMEAQGEREGPSIGATLADGGEPAQDLRRQLGPSEYYGIVSRLVG